MSDGEKKLLITGVGGYIGLWIAKKAIEEHKYEVYGSVTSKANQAKLDKIKAAIGDETFAKLNIVELNLMNEETIDKAVEKMDYILHVASPFPSQTPRDPKEVIDPAVNGTKSVLKAASKYNVKRVVVTSSIAAIMDHTRGSGKEYVVTEENWPPNPTELTPYYQSKYYAEKAADEFEVNQSSDGHKVEVIKVNPGVVMGKLLTKSDGTSEKVFRDILTGAMMSIPQVYFPCVDVQDVADAHFLALEKGCPGERYAIVGGNYYFPDLGQTLYDLFHEYGYESTRAEMCLTTMWLASFFSTDAKQMYRDWRVQCSVSNQKSIDELGMKYKSEKDSLKEMGESFMDLKVIEDKRPKKDEDKSAKGD